MVENAKKKNEKLRPSRNSKYEFKIKTGYEQFGPIVKEMIKRLQSAFSPNTYYHVTLF